MTVKKSKHYEVKRIFIGSPSDLPKERKMFQGIINDVNDIKAKAKGILLEPVGWEDTLPGKGRPQAIINKDLIECDLAVMLLWKRWGTETGEYTSGFEEEYEVAKKNDIEIWFYFRNIPEDSLSDAGPQLGQVIKFRDKMEQEKKYLYRAYKNENDWKKQLTKDLCDWLDGIELSSSQYILPDLPPEFSKIHDAETYLGKIEKLKKGADDYISDQMKEAGELAKKANEYANSGRISKAEEFYSKALSISNDPYMINIFGRFLFGIGELERANEKFDLVMEIAISAKNKDLESIAFNGLGQISQIKGELTKAEKLVSKSLAIDKELGNKEGIAATYGNLGIIKTSKGEYEEAKNLYNKSLKIYEKLDSKVGMLAAYMNLGNVNRIQGNFEEAEILYKKSIELNKELGSKEGMAVIYGNLGIIEAQIGDIEEAEILYKKSIELNKELGSKEGMAITYGNLGVLKKNRGDIEEAEKLYEKALDLNIELGRKEGMAIAYGNLANIKRFQGEPEEAKMLLIKTLNICESLGNAENIKKAKTSIHQLEEEIKKNKK